MVSLATNSDKEKTNHDQYQDNNVSSFISTGTIINDCYCPCCKGDNGITTIVPKNIPLFREIIIFNYFCHDCMYQNNEIKYGGKIQNKGETIMLEVTTEEDLNRQIIKSDYATIVIPEIQFEIPYNTQRGTISTVQGILSRAANALESQQCERLQLGNIDNFYRCKYVIKKLLQYSGEDCSSSSENNDEEEHEKKEDNDTNTEKEREEEKKTLNNDRYNTNYSFTIILDDPSGNSFIENLYGGPNDDPQLKYSKYYRTPLQDISLGLQPQQQTSLLSKEKATTITSIIEDKNLVFNDATNNNNNDIDHKIKTSNNSSLNNNVLPPQQIDNLANRSIQKQQKHHHHNPIIEDEIEDKKKNRYINNNNSFFEIDDTLYNKDNNYLGKREVIEFLGTSCPNCNYTQNNNSCNDTNNSNCITKMCVINIPNFKEVIIMNTICDLCGYKSNEIKGGGCISEFGNIITCTIESIGDLHREVLKSDTAGIRIPELDLEFNYGGGIDGFYTTIEGLLKKIYDILCNMFHPFHDSSDIIVEKGRETEICHNDHADENGNKSNNNDGGDHINTNATTTEINCGVPKKNKTIDSAVSISRRKSTAYIQFLQKLKSISEGKLLPITLIINDPLDNSFIGPPPPPLCNEGGDNHDRYVDHKLTTKDYKRTYEQNEILGLNDIKTEEY